MKRKVLSIICAACFASALPAQEKPGKISGSETSSLTLDGASYDFIFQWNKKATSAHWTGIGFAFSDLDGLEHASLKSSKSYSIILAPVDYIIPLSHNWLVFTGVGFDFSRYHFKGNVGVREVEIADYEGKVISTIAAILPDPLNEYKSSKLITYYVTIPLQLEYQTRLTRRNRFFINGGVEGMVKYYSKSAVEIINGNHVQKVTLGRDLNMRPLNFRFALKAGFEDWSLFGYYQPYSVFKKGEGPDVRPYGIGVMLNF
jgi:hypothetical protein